jgi:hypothetical protein
MRPVFGKGFTRYCLLIVKSEHVSDLSLCANIRIIIPYRWEIEVIIAGITERIVYLPENERGK